MMYIRTHSILEKTLNIKKIKFDETELEPAILSLQPACTTDSATC